MIVSEKDLQQHFRVVIMKKKDYWRICKADGQQFLPTPGLGDGLQAVYDAAGGVSGA